MKMRKWASTVVDPYLIASILAMNLFPTCIKCGKFRWKLSQLLLLDSSESWWRRGNSLAAKTSLINQPLQQLSNLTLFLLKQLGVSSIFLLSFLKGKLSLNREKFANKLYNFCTEKFSKLVLWKWSQTLWYGTLMLKRILKIQLSWIRPNVWKSNCLREISVWQDTCRMRLKKTELKVLTLELLQS